MPATQAVGGVFHTNALACGACALPRHAAELAVSGFGAPSLSPSVGARGRWKLSPTPAGTAATHTFPSEDPAEIAATGPQWRLGDRLRSRGPRAPGPSVHRALLSGAPGPSAAAVTGHPAASPLYQKNVLRGSSTAPDTSRFPLCHGRVAPLATRSRRLRFPQPRSARARVLAGAASGGRAAGPGGPAHWRSVSVPRHLRADRLRACGRRGQPGQCPGHVPAEPAFPADPAHAPDGPQGRHLEAPGLRHLRAQQSRCCGRATRARGGPRGRTGWGGHEDARGATRESGLLAHHPSPAPIWCPQRAVILPLLTMAGRGIPGVLQ